MVTVCLQTVTMCLNFFRRVIIGKEIISGRENLGEGDYLERLFGFGGVGFFCLFDFSDALLGSSLHFVEEVTP